MVDLDQPNENPFQPPTTESPSIAKFVDGDGLATQLRGSTLRRVISIHSPIDAILDYSAWNFRQRILINGKRVWFRWTWVWFHDVAEFTIPALHNESTPCQVRVELRVGKYAQIEYFRILINDQLCYDEVNTRMITWPLKSGKRQALPSLRSAK